MLVNPGADPQAKHVSRDRVLQLCRPQTTDAAQKTGLGQIRKIKIEIGAEKIGLK
jgi:hypothetical protein